MTPFAHITDRAERMQAIQRAFARWMATTDCNLELLP